MDIETGMVSRSDERFPESLLPIVPEVATLYYRGKWRNELFTKCAAVVGSRKISRYGLQVISELAPRLVSAGYTVVSGLMYGVDIEMHRKVIDEGGKAIGVLGYGIDYKNDIQIDNKLYKKIEEEGLILSEWKDIVPKQFTFLLRNRIVVGLCEMVIVVEAADKSGSLHSAAWGRKLGKKVFAVPGPIDSPVSRGTNGLIERGEASSLTWDNWERYLGMTGQSNYSGMGRINQDKYKLNANEKTIVTLLRLEGPQTVNAIARKLREPAGKVNGILTSLNLNGAVTEERGMWAVL